MWSIVSKADDGSKRMNIDLSSTCTGDLWEVSWCNQSAEKVAPKKEKRKELQFKCVC